MAATAASCGFSERTDTWTTLVVPTWVAVTDGAFAMDLATRSDTDELSITSIPSGTSATGALPDVELASTNVWEMGGSRSTDAVAW